MENLSSSTPLIAPSESFTIPLIKIKKEIQSIKTVLAPILWISEHMDWMPIIGDDLKSFAIIFNTAMSTVENAILLTNSATEIVSMGHTIIPTNSGPGKSVFTLLDPFRVKLQKSLDSLILGKQSINQINPDSISLRITREVSTLDDILDETITIYQGLLSDLDLFYEILGNAEERNYLFIAQNSDELRANGGFIVGVWLISFDKGIMKPMVFYDSPDVDNLTKQYPFPPKWLERSLGGGLWVFRDALWFADFAQSAQVAENLFDLGTGIDIDGVIGFNQKLLPHLISGIGNLSLLESSNGVLITKTNINEVIIEGSDTQGRAFIDLIWKEIFNKISELDPADWLNLASIVKEMLDKKNILLYFEDNDAQTKIIANNWGGGLTNQDGDYLMVVDSNVGYNKVNANLQVTYDYNIYISKGGETVGQLFLNYQNKSHGFTNKCVQGLPIGYPSYEELSHGCYWNYLRLYLPKGSIPIAWSNLTLPDGSLYAQLDPFHEKDTFTHYLESNKTVLGGLFVVPQGQQHSLMFSYELPPLISNDKNSNNVYSLVVQKQPGTQDRNLNVSIHYPLEWTLKSSNQLPTFSTEGKSKYNSSLDKDFELKIVFGTR